MTKRGKIIKIISNLYTVTDGHKIYETRARGRFRKDEKTPLVGDFCLFDEESNYILELEDRVNELKRPPVANIDMALIITSLQKPELSLLLLDKELVTILNQNIKPVIVLTKLDLIDNAKKKEILNIMKYYKKIGIKVVSNRNIFGIKRLIKNKTVCVTGQTGAGKSTLLNKLNKSLNIETKPVSDALGRGVHTTRHSEIYEIGSSLVIDTPGFSALDIDVKKEDLPKLFPEFRVNNCKFKDCSHTKEKGCAVIEDVKNNKIMQSRYNNYIKMRDEL